ncbi:hypothetical protein M2101_002198, partial [Parabacteroides sp. PM5-20]|uniref:hypothetical protein n=1 Tax=Parabacteroides sp. PM5-20 TaxID=2940527 RepID=UPI002474BF98
QFDVLSCNPIHYHTEYQTCTQQKTAINSYSKTGIIHYIKNSNCSTTASSGPPLLIQEEEPR